MTCRAICAAAVLAAAGSEAAADGSWTWKLVPYALAPSIDGDAGIGRLTSIGLAVDPVDIIDVLDLGLMIYGEGLHDSGWGFTLDYAFMDLGERGSFAAGAGTADAEVFQGTLTGSVFRRVVDDPGMSVDIYAGFRWWDVDVDVAATLGPLSRTVSVSEDWVDPHIGARMRQQIGDSDWSFLALADVGGFGVASDFAWTLQAGAAWQARENFAVELSYRAVGVDYQTGTPGTPGFFAYDTITHGPVLGLAWTF